MQTVANTFLNTLGATYFASGSHHPGEIVGLAEVGVPVGTTVGCMVGKNYSGLGAERALEETNGPVFLDSGAFSEVKFNVAPKSGENKDVLPRPDLPPFTWFDVAPITGPAWEMKLDVYERIARKIGPRLYCVAPDKVAHHDETIARLVRYADRVRDIAQLGAHVLVAHQKGEGGLVAFHDRAREILDGVDFITAIPMMKNATTCEELEELLTARFIRRIHLLGIGPKSKRYADVIRTIRAASPHTEIFCDSVVITSLVGRTNGPGGGPRVLTAAQDEAREEMLESCYHDGVDHLDYTEMIGDPGSWMTKRQKERMRDALRLDADEWDVLRRDVTEWYQGNADDYGQQVDYLLDEYWAEFVGRASVAWRKAEGLRKVFAGCRGTSSSGQVRLFGL